ncbi:putative Cytochrome P450 monooxygenase [Seiridium unicorne]|uniref:Cytochrome P450 monooxygenase n=1 Tax=Seiridium unicorne TaxID=138068 RepID=A0ABR2V650_9PEZI
MDVTGCLGLAALEAFVLHKLSFGIASDTAATQILGLFLVHYLVLKYYRIVLYHKYVSPLRHLPGPKGGHFLLGQTVNILRAETPTSLYIEWMRKWPDAPFIRYLGVGNREFLLPNSLEAYKEVLQTQCYSFRKPDWFTRMTREVIGKGLLSQEGEEHRANRRMLNVPFSAANTKKLEPLFKEKARGIGSVFDEAISAGDDAGKTGVIDCTEIFSKATLDIMGVAVLGQELSHLSTVQYRAKASDGAPTSIHHDNYSFYQAYHIFFSPGPVGKLLTFFNGFFPMRWLPLQANREFKFAMKWLNATLTQVCRDRFREIRDAKKTNRYDGNAESRDITTFMVEESLPGGSIAGLSEEVFVGHLLQGMAAGHETSATVLSWSLLILAQHQDIQQKLRQEIETLFAHNSEPSYTEIENLAYLDNFIKENLRVYSPSTTYHRQADRDVVIEGYRLPNGTCVDVCPSLAMLNPLIWGEDADKVDVTRWERLTSQQLNPFAFGAFSNGPRICIGRAFALLEIKTILVELVPKYRFLSVEKNYTVENPNLTLRPAGLEIRLEKIHS